MEIRVPYADTAFAGSNHISFVRGYRHHVFGEDWRPYSRLRVWSMSLLEGLGDNIECGLDCLRVSRLPGMPYVGEGRGNIYFAARTMVDGLKMDPTTCLLVNERSC